MGGSASMVYCSISKWTAFCGCALCAVLPFIGDIALIAQVRIFDRGNKPFTSAGTITAHLVLGAMGWLNLCQDDVGATNVSAHRAIQNMWNRKRRPKPPNLP